VEGRRKRNVKGKGLFNLQKRTLVKYFKVLSTTGLIFRLFSIPLEMGILLNI